jgi:hypothetical protein
MCGYEVSSVYTDLEARVDPFALAIQTGKRSVFTEIKKNLIEPQEIPEPIDDNL